MGRGSGAVHRSKKVLAGWRGPYIHSLAQCATVNFFLCSCSALQFRHQCSIDNHLVKQAVLLWYCPCILTSAPGLISQTLQLMKPQTPNATVTPHAPRPGGGVVRHGKSPRACVQSYSFSSGSTGQSPSPSPSPSTCLTLQFHT